MGFTIAISKNRVPVRKNAWIATFAVAFGCVWANSFIGTSNISNWFL